MPRDSGLDALRLVKDEAWQKKEKARELTEIAWVIYNEAREALNSAYNEQQAAHVASRLAQRGLDTIRAANNARINDLRIQKAEKTRAMREAFDMASQASKEGDGKSAATYRDVGRLYQQEARVDDEKIVQLIHEVLDAKQRLADSLAAAQQARTDFGVAKETFQHAKGDHALAQSEFRQAKAELDTAATAFSQRLEMLRVERSRRQEEARLLAEQAGVPRGFLDKLHLVWEPEQVSIYFGGIGRPDGPGHGHYVIDNAGRVLYRRDPFSPRGIHNFENEESFIAIQQGLGYEGGFGLPTHGCLNERPVTVAFGWGIREGEMLFALDHVELSTFKVDHPAHLKPGAAAFAGLRSAFRRGCKGT